MAKPGRRSDRTTDRSAATKKALVDATIEALKDVGFAGASAREIATRADCNQALVFYHFGSVTNLLLAALDEVSVQRMTRYQPLVEHAASVSDLVGAATTIFEEDFEGGDMKVLAELITATSTTEGLADEVARRIEPWRTFAADAVKSVVGPTPLGHVIDADAVGHAMVALFLGLEMLAQLDRDPTPARTLFDHATTLATLAASLLPGGVE